MLSGKRLSNRVEELQIEVDELEVQYEQAIRDEEVIIASGRRIFAPESKSIQYRIRVRRDKIRKLLNDNTRQRIRDAQYFKELIRRREVMERWEKELESLTQLLNNKFQSQLIGNKIDSDEIEDLVKAINKAKLQLGSARKIYSEGISTPRYFGLQLRVKNQEDARKYLEPVQQLKAQLIDKYEKKDDDTFFMDNDQKALVDQLKGKTPVQVDVQTKPKTLEPDWMSMLTDTYQDPKPLDEGDILDILSNN